MNKHLLHKCIHTGGPLHDSGTRKAGRAAALLNSTINFMKGKGTTAR